MVDMQKSSDLTVIPTIDESLETPSRRMAGSYMAFISFTSISAVMKQNESTK